MCTVLLPSGGYPIAVNTYIISYIPEEWSPQQQHSDIIKIKKLVLPWLLKKFPTFYGNLKAHYRVHKTPHNPLLSCATHILSMPSKHVFLRIILISPSQPHLSLASGRQPTHGSYSVSFTVIQLCLVTLRLVNILVDLLA
jgi:hypothetical protein